MSLSYRGRLPKRLQGAADHGGHDGEEKTTSEKPKNAPTHGVFAVEGDGDAAFWTRVGAAWAHRDNQGFNVRLAAVPLSSRLVLRTSWEGGL